MKRLSLKEIRSILVEKKVPPLAISTTMSELESNTLSMSLRYLVVGGHKPIFTEVKDRFEGHDGLWVIDTLKE